MYLITTREITSLTPFKNETNPNVICPFLPCEIELMECFGDVYNKMLADLAVSGLKDYCATDTYEAGDKVNYEGRAYEYIAKNDNETPDCSDSWGMLNKFKNDCFNKVWDFMSAYIAWGIFAESLPFVDIQVTDYGLQYKPNDKYGGGAPSESKYNYYVSQSKSRCDKFMKLLKDKIIKLSDCDSFKTLPFVSSACGVVEDCKKPKRRRVLWKY